jgi:hypothetical protein
MKSGSVGIMYPTEPFIDEALDGDGSNDGEPWFTACTHRPMIRSFP